MGSGDYAVGVAVAVDGEIVHTADFGYRVPPPPAPPSSSTPSMPVVRVAPVVDARPDAAVLRAGHPAGDRDAEHGGRTGRRTDRAR